MFAVLRNFSEWAAKNGGMSENQTESWVVKYSGGGRQQTAREATAAPGRPLAGRTKEFVEGMEELL